MKNKGLRIFVLVLFGLAFESQAQDILDGWYFNPDEPGSGFNVNTQADITGIALFDFDQAGDTQWFTAVDTMGTVDGFNVFEADLRSPENGACFDCPFFPNEGNVSGEPIRIAFQVLSGSDGNTVAEVTLRGTTETYVRTLFNFSSVIDYLLSSWALTQIVPSPVFDGTVTANARVIRFEGVGVLDDGSPFVTGVVSSQSNRPATAVFVPPDGDFVEGSIALFAADVFGELDQFWLFQAFKESLIGVTAIGEDPIALVAAGDSTIFSGGRIGSTFNRNIFTVPGTQALDSLQVTKDQIKAASPEAITAAEALRDRLRQLNSQQ